MRSKKAARRQERKAKKAGKGVPILPDAPSVEPRTDKQGEYLAAIEECDMVIAVGPSGTGKTYIPTAVACEMLRDGAIEKIILCRPAAESEDEQLGFLPGGISRKMEPWVLPFLDVVAGVFGKAEAQRMLNGGVIEIVPFAYMRGRTFRNAFVILDEAQNTTVRQMKLFVSRLGEGVKVVVNGDVTQRDRAGADGLSTAIRLAQTYGAPCRVVTFGKADIVRSALCQSWVEAFEKDEDART